MSISWREREQEQGREQFGWERPKLELRLELELAMELAIEGGIEGAIEGVAAEWSASERHEKTMECASGVVSIQQNAIVTKLASGHGRVQGRGFALGCAGNAGLKLFARSR